MFSIVLNIDIFLHPIQKSTEYQIIVFRETSEPNKFVYVRNLTLESPKLIEVLESGKLTLNDFITDLYNNNSIVLDSISINSKFLVLKKCSRGS
jgi:hypothetical protein